MSKPIISVENLSKAYRIGAKDQSPDTLVGALTNSFRYPLRNLSRLRKLSNIRDGDESDDILWALKDVSFDVNEGEVVGIIGRNGAGKSTLLKILSRITEPTGGRAVIRGRVSSLLEVGTGFHPELTGRENIYMNGTILGMTKREIDRKFDEIVDFSGVEKFLDTPTKRYSSGMQVRLAFAVAAHLEPEILIIDEVLAVGDFEFQRKCLGKMQEVSESGRTVLFVSHRLSAVMQICEKGVLLERGVITYSGSAREAVRRHTQPKFPSNQDSAETLESKDSRYRIHKISLHNSNGGKENSLIGGEDAELTIKFDHSLAGQHAVALKATIYNSAHQAVVSLATDLTSDPWQELPSKGCFTCRIGKLPLPMGSYRLAIAVVVNSEIILHSLSAIEFSVDGSVFYERGKQPDAKYAMVLVDHQWQVQSSTPPSTRADCSMT